MDKRQFLRGAFGLGLVAGAGGVAAAQRQPTAAEESTRLDRERAGRSQGKVPHRTLKTTRLFKSPEGYPNALAATSEGLWIAEQRTDDGQGVSNSAYLVDWKGKVLRKVETGVQKYQWNGTRRRRPMARGECCGEGHISGRPRVRAHDQSSADFLGSRQRRRRMPRRDVAGWQTVDKRTPASRHPPGGPGKLAA